jgi:transcriptional regulator EpsA
MSTVSNLPDADPVQFLRIAAQGTALASHADLWRWLQGDVQEWLAHEVLLVGWGDFRTGDLEFDVVSSMPGMRTHDFTRAGIAPLIGYFRDCWVTARRWPCHLELNGCSQLLGQCASNARGALARMQTALVHGLGDGNCSGERVYAALSAQPVAAPGARTALKLLLPFVDTALRRIPPAPVRQSRCDRSQLAANVMRLADLSEREREIMTWVAGTTNPEIGCILRISEFTVKNPMKSIFAKLDVSNRAQAVATLTRVDAHA